MSDPGRQQFLWPHPGEPRGDDDSIFKPGGWAGGWVGGRAGCKRCSAEFCTVARCRFQCRWQVLRSLLLCCAVQCSSAVPLPGQPFCASLVLRPPLPYFADARACSAAHGAGPGGRRILPGVLGSRGGGSFVAGKEQETHLPAAASGGSGSGDFGSCGCWGGGRGRSKSRGSNSCSSGERVDCGASEPMRGAGAMPGLLQLCYCS